MDKRMLVKKVQARLDRAADQLSHNRRKNNAVQAQLSEVVRKELISMAFPKGSVKIEAGPKSDEFVVTLPSWLHEVLYGEELVG